MKYPNTSNWKLTGKVGKRGESLEVYFTRTFLVHEQNYYGEAEKLSRIFSKILTTLFGGLIVFSGLSLFQTLFRVIFEEKALNESFVLPITCVVPFEINTWPRYTVAFVWIYGAMILTVIHKVTPVCVQVTLCFYTIAVIRDIRADARKFNELA